MASNLQVPISAYEDGLNSSGASQSMLPLPQSSLAPGPPLKGVSVMGSADCPAWCNSSGKVELMRFGNYFHNGVTTISVILLCWMLLLFSCWCCFHVC